LCYFLRQSRTGFQRTDNLITTLMLYAINTGLLTSICATIAVIAFATMPVNFVWLAFFWCLGKFYVNSLLATLNSREALRVKVMPADGTFVPLSHLRTGEGPTDTVLSRQGYRYPHETRRPPPTLTVNVETTKELSTDYPNSARDDSPSSSKDRRLSLNSPRSLTFAPAPSYDAL